MAIRLEIDSAHFPAEFDNFLRRRQDHDATVHTDVSNILAHIREKGDEALIKWTRRFDDFLLDQNTIRLCDEEIAKASKQITKAQSDALAHACDRITDFHLRQKPENHEYHDDLGVRLGWRWSAVESAGLYVPGGLASYPSSVLMNGLPAKIAGVGRLIMCTPTPHGVMNPLILAAAQLAGVDEIYRIGGAQAIGAMAFGTKSIAPVAMIVGPGNAWVAEAKRQLFGQVGIDMIAGPSEVLIIADAHNDPEWVAADLLAQAEHDANAQAILITDKTDFADQVEHCLYRQLAHIKDNTDRAQPSWRNCGAIIIVSDLAQSAPLANRIAPEHLQLLCRDPDALMSKISHAGAIFIGPYTPEALGDYIAGPNHVLPTSGSARFSSGLSVATFCKRTTMVHAPASAYHTLARDAMELARSEGLERHYYSLKIRTNS